MSEEALQGESSSSQPETNESSVSASSGLALEASSQAGAQAVKSAVSSQQPNANAPQVPAPYVPNHKFKFVDPATTKQQEKEFDDWAKKLVKDSATEEEMRKLYARGYGIDSIKNDRTQLRTQLERQTQAHQGLQKEVSTAMNFIKNRDFTSLFESLKVPEQELFKWVQQRIELMQKPQHEQDQFNRVRQQEMQLQQLQEQNQQMQSVAEQYAVQHRANEMESYLARPDLASFAQQYDERNGQNAFRRLIVERGQYHALTGRGDIPAAQAINEALQILGALAPQNQMQQPQAPQAQAIQQSPSALPTENAEQAPQTKAKPVITNVQGRSGSSPVKKTITSVAQLKKIAKDMRAEYSY